MVRKRWCQWIAELIVASSLCLGLAPVQRVHADGKVFQNQLISLGDDRKTIIRHAKQMGYDYINGDPWTHRTAHEGSEAGLGVLFNTGADSAKWMRFDRDLTTINGRPITAQDRANFDKALCMKNPKATKLTERFFVDSQYSKSRSVLFHPNYFSSEAIDIHVAYNAELFRDHGGAATHAGVYIDQVNYNESSPYPGPCYNPGPKNFATAVDGQLEYIRRLQRYFRDHLGLPVSGNPYRIRHYRTRHLLAPFDLYYNENGSLEANEDSDFGGIPADLVITALPANNQQDNDYLQALRTAGIAMQQGSWFGWYARAKPSQTKNGVQLLRALPNWDNLLDSSSRSWDPDSLVYKTSNSYADPHVVYGRHPKTRKLFVVFKSLQGVVQLKSGETVTDVKRVDELFVETTDGEGDLDISGSRIALEKSSNTGKGYILTVR